MTTHDLQNLQPGDIIVSQRTKAAYIVTGNYGTHVVAVRTVDVTHAPEWDLASKAQHAPARGVAP